MVVFTGMSARLACRLGVVPGAAQVLGACRRLSHTRSGILGAHLPEGGDGRAVAMQQRGAKGLAPSQRKALNLVRPPPSPSPCPYPLPVLVWSSQLVDQSDGMAMRVIRYILHHGHEIDTIYITPWPNGTALPLEWRSVVHQRPQKQHYWRPMVRNII